MRYYSNLFFEMEYKTNLIFLNDYIETNHKQQFREIDQVVE